jgi:hypothetical protein
VGLPSKACGFGDDCAAPSPASLSSLSDESPVFPPPGVCARREESGEGSPRHGAPAVPGTVWRRVRHPQLRATPPRGVPRGRGSRPCTPEIPGPEAAGAARLGGWGERRGDGVWGTEATPCAPAHLRGPVFVVTVARRHGVRLSLTLSQRPLCTTNREPFFFFG